jgi:hypothetical protein
MESLLQRLGLGFRLLIPLIAAALTGWVTAEWYRKLMFDAVSTALPRGHAININILIDHAWWLMFWCCMTAPFVLALTFFGDWERYLSRLRDIDHLNRAAAASANEEVKKLSAWATVPTWRGEIARRVRGQLLSRVSWLSFYVSDSAFDRWHDRVAREIDQNSRGPAADQLERARSLACELAFARRLTRLWFIPSMVTLVLASLLLGYAVTKQFYGLTYAYRDTLVTQFTYFSPVDGKELGRPPDDRFIPAVVGNYVESEAVRAVGLDIYEILDRPNPLDDVPLLKGSTWLQPPAVMDLRNTKAKGGQDNKEFKYAVIAFRSTLTLLVFPLLILMLKMLSGLMGRLWSRNGRAAVAAAS